MIKKIFHVFVYILALFGLGSIVVYFAVQWGLTNTPGIIDNQRNFFKEQVNSTKSQTSSVLSSLPNTWQQDQEWQSLKQAVMKDEKAIKSASEKTGIPSRFIVNHLIVEQLRIFHSDRELFKTIFSPLKILAIQSQFSWGVMGIKQDTARQIEVNLRNTDSNWYLGPQYEHLLDFSTDDHDNERFERLTNEKDRSYSYLYLAIMLKQFEAQWQKAGFPINNRPEILATLCNIGFWNSKPNADPQIGGAEINIGGTKYSFGGLAGSFYYSDELLDVFPR